MSNEQLLFNTCLFFTSEKWWRPIISFVYSNNEVFKSDQQNTSINSQKICFSHQQYEKFIEFSNIVIALIDKTLCSYLGISNQMLENILFSTCEDGNIQSRVIIDTLQKTMSFTDFRNEMFRYSLRTEEIINETIIEITTSTTIDLNDSESLAKKVAETTQSKIDYEVNALIEKGCRQMRALLNIDTTRPSIPGSPQKRPLPNTPEKNKPTNLIIFDEKEINPNKNNETNKLQPTTSAHPQPLISTVRNINRSHPLHPKVPLAKISLNSSSSSISNNEEEESCSSVTSHLSKSAPQSPFSTAESRFSTHSSIKPLDFNINTPTNSPTKPFKNLSESYNSDDQQQQQQLDRDEVERRRQFYIKQRDILSKKEHRKPPSHHIIKPQKPIHKKIPSNSPANKQKKYYTKIEE